MRQYCEINHTVTTSLPLSPRETALRALRMSRKRAANTSLADDVRAIARQEAKHFMKQLLKGDL